MNYKQTVTLCMIWIGAMALASSPEWARAARDFVTVRAAGKVAAPPKSTAPAGGSGKGRLQ